MSEKYSVKFDFTSERQDDLKQGVLTETAAKRLIKAVHGIDPSTDNGNGDIRYKTDDPALALELLRMVFTDAKGGWICIEPMPKNRNVFHLTNN